MAKQHGQILPDITALPPSHAPFTATLLSQITDTMTHIVKSYSTDDTNTNNSSNNNSSDGNSDDAANTTNPNKLRLALLSNQYRSELFNSMIIIADEVHDVGCAWVNYE